METPSSGTATPGSDLENGPGQIRKRLTVTLRDLNVRVTAPDAALGSTLWSEVDPRQLGGLIKRGDRPKRVGVPPQIEEYILTYLSDHSQGYWRPSQAWRNGML